MSTFDGAQDEMSNAVEPPAHLDLECRKPKEDLVLAEVATGKSSLIKASEVVRSIFVMAILIEHSFYSTK